MSVSLVLFEHAAGYGLFKVKEFEEISALQAEVEASVQDVSAFNSVVNMMAFSPFKNAADALANINAVSEGLATDQLKFFLEANLPKKLKKVLLGVLDPKLGSAVSEALGVKVTHVGVVPEIVRGIRMHFNKLVKALSSESSLKSQLGLGHAYSRCKVKLNVHRSDNMIIQSIALLDQLDKDVNTFSMRMREWYSYHFPELIKIVSDNYTFARCVNIIKNRKELTDEKMAALEEVVMDSAKARAIIDASKSSMGMDISVLDLFNIERFGKRVIALAEYRKQLMTYLQDKMANVAPNLAALIGDTVGARLISHAGSLTNLAKYPASTVQILGAEKALFRALKTKGNTPKYGLIFHSSFIGRAGAKNKGRISRYLANKCSIASRIDCFMDISTNIFGSKLKEQVEDRLKFYETGDLPKKNVDVMIEAMDALKSETAEFQTEKKKKKKNKRKAEEMEEEKTEEIEESGEKKKKRKKTEDLEDVKDEELTKSGKKKKKKHAEEEPQEIKEEPQEIKKEPQDDLTTSGKKKKKKNKTLDESQMEVDESIMTNSEKKKKKKKKADSDDE